MKQFWKYGRITGVFKSVKTIRIINFWNCFNFGLSVKNKGGDNYDIIWFFFLILFFHCNVYSIPLFEYLCLQKNYLRVLSSQLLEVFYDDFITSRCISNFPAMLPHLYTLIPQRFHIDHMPIIYILLFLFFIIVWCILLFYLSPSYSMCSVA